jgi:transcriptional regulator with XRE-family HTH domain
MSPRQRKEVDTSTYSGRFALRLKMLREKTGMTVDQLAEASGISRKTLYNWESRMRAPSIDDVLLILAEHLNVEVRTLLPKE